MARPTSPGYSVSGLYSGVVCFEIPPAKAAHHLLPAFFSLQAGTRLDSLLVAVLRMQSAIQAVIHISNAQREELGRVMQMLLGVWWGAAHNGVNMRLQSHSEVLWYATERIGPRRPSLS